MIRTVSLRTWAGLLVLLLAGCELLWAPLQARVNPLDAEADSTRTLTPTVDGTVPLLAPLNTTILSVSDIQYALIRFELGQLPAVVTEATLVLECTAVAAQTIEAYAIGQDWDRASVAQTQVTSAGLLLTPTVGSRYVDGLGSWTWDLSLVVGDLHYGLALKGTQTGFVQFNSTEGPNEPKPYLRVVGHD